MNWRKSWRGLMIALAAAMTGCAATPPASPDPLAPLAGIHSRALNSDGTFRKNGLRPADAGLQQ